MPPDGAPLRGELQLDGRLFRVAPFTEKDLDVICSIEGRAHPLPWAKQHFTSSLTTAHHHCLGIQHAGSWIGYAVVGCIADEAELLLLVVDSPWQGYGVGRIFLDWLCQSFAPRASTLFLEVRASNAPAIALYEQLNFHQVGLRRGYYPLPKGAEDALIYARTLEVPADSSVP